MLKNILKIYRVILIVLALVFLVWLLNKNIVSEGKLYISKDFCEKSNFISELYPEERVGLIEKQDGICWQKIFVEPVYFKVKVPRTFDTAKATIHYNEKKIISFRLAFHSKDS